ncbi:MAG: tryptophan--tRNA ligase [Acidobacteriia bacterium]|nr:tryptophan--tRNA ligase [Terriglobia bacterium]
MDNETGNPRSRVLSGMRPTGKLHLGNYVGALQNWVKLQHTHDCFFFVADWHALTTDYDDTSRVADNTLEVMLDYLGAGLDPAKCTMFVQSHVREHAELHLLFSMITPLSWLERVPTYKEQQQNMPNKDLHMYGFLGYPLLQSADILLYRPKYVPVGEDQAAHVELTREVARRFNNFYPLNDKAVFPEPEVLLTPSPKLLGTDKRKMSKSYGNSILLSDDAATVAEKIKGSVTDRPRLTDRGSPDRCGVGNLHQIFSDRERLTSITEGCTQATITCVECKALATRSVNAHLDPIRERRSKLARNPGDLKEIVRRGAEKAASAAEETMADVRKSIGLLRISSVEEFAAPGPGGSLLRVPESIAAAKTDEERWDIRVNAWHEHINKSHSLKKDKRGLYITQKSRKVGVHAAPEERDGWEFTFKDRPVNVLVLLAEDRDRYLHPYVLPPKFLQEHWKQFPREGDLISLWIRKIDGAAVLALAADNLLIQEFEGDYSALL